MRSNWLILLLDENKVTGEIREITQAVGLADLFFAVLLGA